MKLHLSLLLLALLLPGCSTPNLATRKKERLQAYQALPPEYQQLVDRGQIKVGMNEDAVYIAWGPPAEIVESETEAGHTTVWIYHGAWYEETRFWSFREINHQGTPFLERVLERDYFPRSYVRAEIYFQSGKVARWRTLPRPL